MVRRLDRGLGAQQRHRIPEETLINRRSCQAADLSPQANLTSAKRSRFQGHEAAVALLILNRHRSRQRFRAAAGIMPQRYVLRFLHPDQDILLTCDNFDSLIPGRSLTP